MTERIIDVDSIPGHASRLNPDLKAMPTDPDTVTVEDGNNPLPRPSTETLRDEYRGQGLGVISTGEMVSGRHETIAPLDPQDGPQPPRAPQ